MIMLSASSGLSSYSVLVLNREKVDVVWTIDITVIFSATTSGTPSLIPLALASSLQQHVLVGSSRRGQPR